MLEDITSEKKMSRTVQSLKGVAEAKNNQDVAAAKVYPKVPKPRGRTAPKDDQPRTPCSTAKGKQRSRKVSTRSHHHEIGGTVAELAGLDDGHFDSKRNKKQNLAHLLNIQCTPRVTYSSYSPSRGRGFPPNNSIRFLMGTQKHKYNKEQFLLANCQFVVRDDADYSVHMALPDILVDWNLIEQIRVSSFEPGTCPICLNRLVAGKITRCGHIFCWPCIIHHSTFTDRSWCKCPMCYEAVNVKDLKSVQIVNQTCFNKGQEIIFQLMKKEKGSTVSVPVLEPSRVSNTLLSLSETKYTTAYSKLLTVDSENVLGIIDIEEEQLRNLLKETEEASEKSFIVLALDWLEIRRTELLARTGRNKAKKFDCEKACDTGDAIKTVLEPPKCTPLEPCCSKSNDDIQFDVGNDHPDNISLNDTKSDSEDLASSEIQQTSRTRFESVSSNDEVVAAITVEDLEIGTPNTISSKYYYFYQSIDGQFIYLHSLNARMLEKQYGSLERSPRIVVGNIVEIEAGSMTEELRKRLRYLDHLPLTCQFQVVEIDLGEPMVSSATLGFFKDQLEKRCRLRQKKEREEKRLEKQAEMMIRKQYGCGTSSSPVRLNLDSLDHFPQCGAEEPAKSFQKKEKSPRSSRSCSPGSSRRSDSSVTSADTVASTDHTFAQKLKNTNKNGGWQNRIRGNSESDNSGGPSSGNGFSEAFDAAFKQALLVKEGLNGEQRVSKNKKKNKRKPKSIPLVSLGMMNNL